MKSGYQLSCTFRDSRKAFKKGLGRLEIAEEVFKKLISGAVKASWRVPTRGTKVITIDNLNNGIFIGCPTGY
jgi:hypothetical protein